MLMYGLVAAALAVRTPPVDTVAVYATILREVRMRHPDVPVVLAETRSGVECMPHCGAIFQNGPEPGQRAHAENPRDHSREVIRRLREQALIDTTCAVPADVFGCGTIHPGHLFVALGEIRESPPGGPRPEAEGFWVRVALLEPEGAASGSDASATPDAYGIWTLVRREADCSWTVVKILPAFSI